LAATKKKKPGIFGPGLQVFTASFGSADIRQRIKTGRAGPEGPDNNNTRNHNRS
jgi:hypothetical protein